MPLYQSPSDCFRAYSALPSLRWFRVGVHAGIFFIDPGVQECRGYVHVCQLPVLPCRVFGIMVISKMPHRRVDDCNQESLECPVGSGLELCFESLKTRYFC